MSKPVTIARGWGGGVVKGVGRKSAWKRQFGTEPRKTAKVPLQRGANNNEPVKGVGEARPTDRFAILVQ